MGTRRSFGGADWRLLAAGWLAACIAGVNANAATTPSFELLATYNTQLADTATAESAAETSALRYGRLFVTNAADVSLDIVNVANPKFPVLLKRVSLSAYGAKVNSVDVSVFGIVAVAVQAPVKTDRGKVVLLGLNGNVLRVVEVGSLPDMVTFTPDGTKLLVANEGEPDCYGGGCTDPEGTVTIITVLPWLPVKAPQTVGFANVALPEGVRIYGPNSTPAQDLEPEYVTVSEDGRKAWVTLQENNAIAEIDVRAARVTAVHPLGYKDFNSAPDVQTLEVDLPSAGVTAAGQEIFGGGLSGLFFEGTTGDGKLKFIANTDRGPNGAPTGLVRPFLLPNFTPRLVRLEVDPADSSVAVTQTILLKRTDGTPLTGLPNVQISSDDKTPYNDEIAVDLFGNTLATDPLGADLEGVAVAADGSFWMSDEYRPAIYHFSANGALLQRYIPIGTHAAAGLSVPAAGVAGALGIEALPAVLGQRRQNRGMEALALANGKVYAFVQSPLRNPPTLTNQNLDNLKNVRLVEFAPATLVTRQFIYIMDQPTSGGADSRADKIGDMAALPGGGFIVVERDDDSSPADPNATITKLVYAFNLNGATEITSKDVIYNVGGVPKSLDQMTQSELSAAAGVNPIAKVLRVDLVAAGYSTVQKVEGLAVIDADTIAVVNDNDFGVAVIAIDNATGTFTRGYTPEPTLLGLIRTPGLDASDTDRVINIRGWPVYGMYQPDAIAAYVTGGRRYLVTANEGDARVYDGFNEEARARALKDLFQGIPAVNSDPQLGRLTITNTPPDGDFSRPYVFGARSFSIWNAVSGEQVWDSGSDFEVLIGEKLPLNFNSNNDANNFDNRSDNKGPEPEGVDVGRIGGRSYAFVGFERVGGVAVYDVTDPASPFFVQYLKNRDFGVLPVGPDSGPEVIHFVPPLQSPNGKAMLVVSNEISGTVSLWGLSRARAWWDFWWRLRPHH